MKRTRNLHIALLAALAVAVAVPRQAPCEPAPLPTTIGIRDASQPPVAARDPMPFVPKASTRKKPPARKNAASRPRPQASARPVAPVPPKPRVQAAPPLPSPEELNRQYTTPKESLSTLLDAAQAPPAPDSGPKPAQAPSGPAPGPKPAQEAPVAAPGPKPAQGEPTAAPGPKPAQATAAVPKTP
ncbi:hypothetical protein [Desulfolutivibrio sulfoxidireducens]|uniref:hypothetical protein n=1 Tax=Desulfolutivibrio sulfoxidireducens TaxID=2773299 RepID=UPI00159E9CCA|nr:hypothetical protein [Desulfolutivibrio sulfoxidireducens]QLA16964.1 hypothetical protein GD605_13120 [Desulfolutivibrio sulfoxidireducens]QLA20531.1 hypothetical protein GD604_12835 [Desulfolutivibrio sulfoxidireducens]